MSRIGFDLSNSSVEGGTQKQETTHKERERERNNTTKMLKFFSSFVVLLVLHCSFSSLLVEAKPGTSLEGAFIRAYNERVADGSWASIFGSIGLLSQDYCPGSTKLWDWPFPNEVLPFWKIF